jgi:ATP-dependent Zn protease
MTKKNKKKLKDKKLVINFPEQSKKPKKWQPFVTVIVVLLLIFGINSIFGDSLKYDDKSVAISELVSSYNSGKYSEIVVDENKAYAILKGESGNKKLREIAVIPLGSSIKDLELNNSENDTKVSVKDNTTAKFVAEVLPTILMIVLF